jgi:tetratricopeptide (TPR) repeat protein
VVAIEQYKKTLELDPNYAPALIELGRVYTVLGQMTQALPELERAAQVSNRSSSSLAALGYAYGVFGSRDRALNILSELRDRSTHAYVSPADYAIVYLGLRDDDRVFQELARAADLRLSSLCTLRTAPEFDPIRTDSRFADLLRRVHLNRSRGAQDRTPSRRGVRIGSLAIEGRQPVNHDRGRLDVAWRQTGSGVDDESLAVV